MDEHDDNKLNQYDRRVLLKLLAAAGTSMALFGCVNSAVNKGVAGSGTTSSSPTDATNSSCSVVPTETNGPFPADGTNTAGDGSSTKLDKVYSNSPIIRSSIAEGLLGVPLNLTITLQNTNNYCSELSGYYVYIWHCTSDGKYSSYTATNNGGTHSSSENYMRGIQQTDAVGQVNFETIYPGWYAGRAIHIHVEIYRNLDDATPVKITQLAFPMSTNKVVAAVTSQGYSGVSGMLDNSADNIFSDGVSLQMVAISGSVSSGYNANIAIGVSA